ncbi:MAG: MATE family efflux transporter [Clostridium cadaveris]|uniref:Probable multidrug resistance protein NorM n=1 Tax=Clostridium cadaveris TaxID=1529 RepID=A0A316M5T9_9CLOT|nr:MATE family efflux transporter [Clostridium cadaveris]MDY4949807.1 MATE family efflux transporter [Clostridium cadaveris]NWK11208.1 MATE family efflux transporter [Clostridium cadaveris]PWL53381.1 MAG: MATE family efflux transporter [Clostridium cadaveris]UFH64179.1 MATE family efflux transporter [Clostridium cadaveris]
MDSSSSLMTEGCIWRKIVKFALPICWGNLFQQLYNIVDSVVVGNFVGRDALAAISSTGSLIFLLVGFFGGIFMGAGVVISKYFGAGKKDSVQRSIHTSIAFAIIAGIILTIVGTLLTPQILRLMGTPDSVFSNATLYVRIYFMGILSIVLYNTSSGIFQAVGDSKHPLYYLIISSIVNVVLDLIFVVVFEWGIGGAAIATVISQTVSVVLAFYKLSTTTDVYKIDFKKIRIDPMILKEIIRLGLPAGIQNSVIALANVVVQANINAFGSVAMAGCGSYSKIEGFVFIPITSFAMSMTTFIGQNLGAKKYDRAKEGAKFGIISSLILAEIIGIIFFILAPQLVSLFNTEPEVVQFGTSQSRTIALFYFLLAFSHCIAGILRGAGKSIVPMFVMLLCWCIIRVTYITITTHFIPQIQVVFWAYPLTWSLSSIIFLIYYLKSDWIHGFEKK